MNGRELYLIGWPEVAPTSPVAAPWSILGRCQWCGNDGWLLAVMCVTEFRDTFLLFALCAACVSDAASELARKRTTPETDGHTEWGLTDADK